MRVKKQEVLNTEQFKLAKIVGDRIKDLRIKAKMSQEELGKRIGGCTKQDIYKYENAIIKNIKSSVIKKIASIFGVSPTYIMGWEEEVQEEIKVEMLSSEEIALIHAIRDLTDEEVKELSNFVDYLISKRK